MKVVTSINELRKERTSLLEPVGLVPTMGFLHEGHLSLVGQALKQCASVVVSIFVNPTQFGPNEDLGRYPRDLERDKASLEREGVHILWTPLPEQMYPPGYQTWVTVDEMTSSLEGAVRSGHFRGVTTVVAKIFNAVQPEKAFFGQKDAQQAAVIRRMTMDLNFPVEIVVCPTVREPDGLAKSSRNVYLHTEERKAATVLYRSLSAARDAFEAGERDAKELRRIMEDVLAGEALAQPQYVSCADPQTLQELDYVKDNVLLSMAVYVGTTRLIDNILIQKEK
jgi:pantoate--beta-alanine ligase